MVIVPSKVGIGLRQRAIEFNQRFWIGRLEEHHIIELAILLERHIKSRVFGTDRLEYLRRFIGLFGCYEWIEDREVRGNFRERVRIVLLAQTVGERLNRLWRDDQ